MAHQEPTPRLTPRAALPGVLLLVLFGACVLLAVAAPSRGYEQIHYVAVATDQDNWATIPRAALSCAEVDRTETCAVDVVGRRLEVLLRRGVTDGGPISCTANYAGAPKPCDATFAYSEGGDGAVAVLSMGIGLTPAEAELLPKWSIPAGVVAVGLGVVGLLATAAALVAGFGGRKPVDNGFTLIWTAGLGWFVLLFAALALLGGTLDALARPETVLVAVLLVVWQWTLTRPGYRLGVARAVGAFLMTAVTGVVAAYVFLIAGGFIA
ncbi:hypothetical protein [Actinokineospora globicatena]|uniref:Uncharacterized protein n=1 Tax=Actinokineospora globicatena TaxID=103729 RepID=A0A9W6QSH6_9PSEU|nr:hypothetical protein [Actinokineospora globicatena]GLW95370.1 hypothetical protein Aglo03_61860 [Actinokineospora globicatena]